MSALATAAPAGGENRELSQTQPSSRAGVVTMRRVLVVAAMFALLLLQPLLSEAGGVDQSANSAGTADPSGPQTLAPKKHATRPPLTQRPRPQRPNPSPGAGSASPQRPPPSSTDPPVSDRNAPAPVAVATSAPVATLAAPSVALQLSAAMPPKLTQGWNPKACNVRPNQTDIDPYKGCPVPGLNNLLYTQHNRWYCLYRDKERMLLRDRTCNKGSGEKYRYSTVLQVRYDRIARFQEWQAARKAAGISGDIEFGNSRRGGRGGLLPSSLPKASDPQAVRDAYDAFARQMNDVTPLDTSLTPPSAAAAICWADIKEKVLPRKCTWSDIPSFYGKPEWWESRHFIDMHSEYYTAARQILSATIGPDVPFVSLHLRRGDYMHHCQVIQKKRTPAWVSFWPTKTLLSGDGAAFASCYPTVEQVAQVIDRVTKETGIPYVFIATNEPGEFANLTTPLHEIRSGVAAAAAAKGSKRAWRAFVLPKLTSLQPTPIVAMRHLDTLILDMVVLSLGSHFVLNRYSSFSATVYEMATIHGRTNESNVVCW